MEICIIEGSLEVKLPTIWTDEKAEVRRARREQSQRGEKSEDKRSEEDAGVRKGRKVAKHCVFSMFCGSGGSKSRLAKAAGAETSGEMRNEKLHAVVARSRFWSEKVQNTWVSEHFWKLRCRKSARRCGEKHISKWKCTKHLGLGALLEVAMSKKCTPLWREAHFEVNMYKTPQCRTTFGGWDVEKVHAVVARSTFRSEHVQNTSVSDHFWRLRCRKSARCCGPKHISKSKVQTNWGVRNTFGRSDVVLHGRRKGLCTLSKVSKTWGFCSNVNYNHHYTTLRYNYNYTFTTFQYTTLDYTTLHSITLNYTTLHYITLHSTTLHYLRHTSLHYTTPDHTTLHYTPQHYNYNYNYTTTTTQLHSTTLN